MELERTFNCCVCKEKRDITQAIECPNYENLMCMSRKGRVDGQCSVRVSLRNHASLWQQSFNSYFKAALQ
jgi:hypothetical protein